MDIQKEIELYKKYRDSKLNNFGLRLSDFKNLDEYLGCLTWLNAKSQAVPKGFVLINKSDLAKVLNCVTDDLLIDTNSMNEFNEIESLVMDEIVLIFKD